MMDDDAGHGMGEMGAGMMGRMGAGMMDGMGAGMMGWMAGSMLVWGLVGIAVLVLLVVTISRLLRAGERGSGSSPGNGRPDSAEEMLRRRYASGEIDDEEYQRRRAALA